MHRFGSNNSRASSKSSGGWKAAVIDSDDDDDDDDDVVTQQAHSPAPGPGENEFIKVIAPPEETSTEKTPVATQAPQRAPSPSTPTEAHELKRETEAREPLEQNVPQELHEVHQESAQTPQPKPHAHDDEDDELNIPGSFNPRRHHHSNSHHLSWAELFKKMHIKS